MAALLSLPFCSFKARPAGRDVFGERRVFVRSGSQAILFDALFGTGLPDYDRVPPTAMDEIERGKPPFANIDALLISHVHADHFNLPSTVRFLKTHPATIVVAPDQVSKQIHKALTGDSQALSRIHTATLEQNSITTRDEGGVRIGSFPLTHGNIENAAYLVVLDRRTVLHIGDADLPMKGLAQFGLSHRRIDLAFVPFWQLTDNPKRVQTLIAAKVVIPMHLITNPTTDTSKGFMEHVGGRERMLRQIRICFPNAAIFLAPLETKSF
ncbi:MAG: MBL fold metallo-hydrolase [Acidobacteriaceae bacterium]|nr:MBL fold metallo-hydrolase [Acidobacteriaceae bacterium]